MDSIDWPGIRAASVTLGIRGSARAASSHLPQDEQDRFVERVMKRASREGWETSRQTVMVSAGLSAEVSATSARRPELNRVNAKPLSAQVRTGSETLVNVDADHSRRSRSAGLEYAALVTEHAARQAKGDPGLGIEPNPDLALEKARLVKSALQGAALAGCWKQSTAPTFTLNLFAVSGSMKDAIDV